MSPDLALVSGSDRLRYASYVGHQLYARRFGHPYHLELAPFPGHGHYWHKLMALREHLERYEWLVWLDDDAFVTDLRTDVLGDAVRRAQEAGRWLVIAPSCDDELNGAWAAYNTGVFALRRSEQARALLDLALDPPLAEIEAWWPAERLGVFTHGDQDLLAWFVEQGHRDGVELVDPMTWNARPWHYRSSLQDRPVVHFPGQPDKTLAIERSARRMGVGPTLVAGSDPGRPLLESPTRQVASASTLSLATRTAAAAARRGRTRVVRKVRWVRETGRWS